MNTAVLVVVLCAALCDAHRGRDRGYYSGGQRRRGPPIPPYLKYVSREARREYSNIVTSTDKTIADKKQEIIEWGQKYGIQDKVKDFNEKVESIRSQMMQNATELIKALPTALEQFSAIKKNKDQTSSQRDKALEELRASDPRVYDVLQYIFQQFKPGDPHGRRGYQGIDGFGRLGDLCRLSGTSDDFEDEGMTGSPRGNGGFGRRSWLGCFQCWQFCLVLENLSQMNTALIALIVIGVVMCEPRQGRGHSGEDDHGHHHHGGHHHGGHGCHHRGPPPPPFLKNVSKAARHAYFEIIFNENETIAEQNKDVLDWGKKYGIEEQVEEFFKNMSETRAEAKQNVTKVIEALPKAMEEFVAIMENEDQTRPQQREALRVLKEKDPEVQSALRFIMDMYRPKRPCHPHHKPRRPESESAEESNDVKEKRDLGGFDDSGEDNE